mgnify:CR=1 FL=1
MNNDFPLSLAIKTIPTGERGFDAEAEVNRLTAPYEIMFDSKSTSALTGRIPERIRARNDIRELKKPH